jgi:acetyltransferase-like isoleucine patch superfamily enzyme
MSDGRGGTRHRSRLQKALSEPSTALSMGAALMKGFWYKIWFPLTGRRFSAGKRFLVFGRLKVSGPGLVRFGDYVQVGMTVTPFTHAADAVIEVGDRTFLNGTRFGCQRRISIGPLCILAECRILDTNFHSVNRSRHDPNAAVVVSPVVIGQNVWVCADASILPGTIVGDNSVIGIASVCRGQIEANAIYAGNPCRKVGEIPE